MQKLVQKAVFAALLVSSSAFAEGDLLSKATDGAVVSSKAETTEAKALSVGEMKEVKGGIYVPMRLNSYPIYLQRLSAFTRVKTPGRGL